MKKFIFRAVEAKEREKNVAKQQKNPVKNQLNFFSERQEEV
jgi:hypothetical protein